MISRLLASAALLASASLMSATPLRFEGIISTARVVRTIDPSATGSTAPTNVGVGLLSYTNLVTNELLYYYCIEPQQGTGLAGTIVDYNVDSTLQSAPLNNGGISAGAATAIRLLLGQYSDPFSNALTALQQAAMQVAIWEIVRETGGGPYSASTGIITFTDAGTDPGVVAAAQLLLNAVNSNSGSAYSGAVALVSFSNQDLVGVQPVPEPATFALVGAGLLGLGVFRSRRSR